MLLKKLRIIFLSLLFFSLFVSCENSISYDDEEIQSSITSEEVNTPAPVKYASINGFYQNYEGALPAGIHKAIAEINTARSDIKNRSAYPGLNTTLNEIQYYVTATAENEKVVSGSVSVENKSYSVSGLKFGIDWTVEVGIKVKQTGEGETENWIRCFYDVSEPVRITESNIAVSRNLILKPDTSGYGSVELNLTTDSSITGLEIELDDNEQNAKWQAALAADEEKEISASKIKLANLPAGQYNLVLLFKRNGESYPCYSSPQTINVINGMTTDTWQSNGTSLISDAGAFNLTSTIISNYVDSCIYVGPNSASNSIGITPNDSNEGRAYSPLASVNEAIKRIRNANVRRDYKIFVSGECAENIKIGGTGENDLPSTAAASITIQGLNNNAADVLMSPGYSTAPCLSIQTDIPVIFKNIKITTVSDSLSGVYNTSAQGGGLYIKTGTVTLDSGAWVGDCFTDSQTETQMQGAGIYLDSGKLTIKTGAKISNNQVINTKTLGAAEGGGIYINSGTVEICGGEISGNSASSSGISGTKAGGGIYINSGTLLLNGSFDMPSSGSAAYNDIYVKAAGSIKIKNAIRPQTGTSGPLATITPAATLGRNASIVSLVSGSSLSSIAPYKDYFTLSNNDWIIKANSAGNALVLDAPIYVAGQVTHPVTGKAGKAAADGGNGTKSAPFDSIDNAISAIVVAWNEAENYTAAENYTIYVDGQIIGLQSIPSSLTSSHASGITIQGASGNTSDILNGSGLGFGSGTVLTISSPVPVTIKDLKITGGNTTGNGGGINMISGSTVTLESGALIGGTSGSTAASDTEHSANYADKGGGIYSEGNLTLKNGSAVIYNYGTDGGGIYCNGGSLTIEAGAKVNLNGTNTTGGGISIAGSEFSMTGGEVCNNISNNGAGGLYIAKDSSDNCPALITISGATISGNSADVNGSSGGIYYLGGQTLAITGNTVISGNHCKFEGGGIRVAPGVLDLSDCTISGNYSLNGTRPGGGIAANAGGSIKLSGSVYIPAGATIGETVHYGEGCNDVRQNYGSIKIKGALTPPAECTDDGIIATITPMSYIRGTSIIEAEGSITNLTSYKDNFALTYADAGWNYKLTPDNTALKLDAPIYVKGNNSVVCTGAAGSDGNGSKSAPLDTIANACALMSDSTWDYTILVDGTITRSQISASPSAHSITLKGANSFTSNDDRKDIINAGGSGTALSIQYILSGDTSVPVTIENLKITGGAQGSGGAGIHIGNYRKVTLGDDLLVQGNNGPGVYVSSSGSTLNVKGNVVVSGNTVYNDSSKPCNVYLPVGKKINVVGVLKKGDEKAQIGISTENPPTLTSTIAFTTNYGPYNTGIAPGTYFTGDTYNVTMIDDEAALVSNVEVINTENIETLILTAGNNYNFVLSSDCTLSTMETLISKIKNSSIGNSKIDLSNTSITNISTASWIPAKITSLTLPSTFNRVGSQDFQDANDLEEINISDDNQYFKVIDGVLYDKALTTVVKYPAAKTGEILNLPDTVTTIKMQAFKNNKNLVTINGLDRITSIRSDSGHAIFYYSQKLEEVDFSSVTDDQLPYCTFDTSSVIKVTLSPSITKIGTRNFIYCTRLTEVHLKTSEPPVLCANEIGTISNEKIFTNNNTNLKIYVPAGSKAAYLADTDREGGFANPSYNGLASRADFSDLIIEE